MSSWASFLLSQNYRWSIAKISAYIEDNIDEYLIQYVLYRGNDKRVLISYCHKLHYCHNMDVMINGLITLMLARYLSMHITLTRVTCTL